MEKLDPELEVGIQTFLCEGKQIKGIFKYKISDFVVNEINLDKKVLFYDRKEAKQINQKIKEQKQPTIKKFNIDDEEKLKEIFPEAYDTILKFYQDLENGEKKSEFNILIKCPPEKEDRIKIHEFVREKMPFFDSSTQKDSNKILVQYTKNCAKKQKTAPNCIIQAIMFKKGIDTLSASQKISQLLRTGTNYITTAGIKDKRGITTQNITFKGHFEIDSLNHRLANAMFNDNIKLSNFELKENALKVGDLYGNRFSVLIRLFQAEQDDIIKNYENLSKWGFINYFGTQRFGNTNLGRSHIIGLSILKRDFKEAFNLILTIDKNFDKNLYEKMEEYKQKLDSKDM